MGEAPVSAGPRPFLRRNSGWEARVAAAREGRRYVPPGGAIKDYAKEAGSGPSLAKLLSAPKPAPAAQRGRRGAAVVPAAPAVDAAPPATQARRFAHSPLCPMQQQERQPAGSKQPARVRASTSRPLQPAAAATPVDAVPDQVPAAATDWARKLLAGGSSKSRRPPASSTSVTTALGDEQEDAELAEFQALESQVLCEVSNTAQPSSPAHRFPAGKKLALGSGSRSSGAAHTVMQAQHIALPGQQQQQQQHMLQHSAEDLLAGSEAAEQDLVDDVFQSDDEGNVCNPLSLPGSPLAAPAEAAARPHVLSAAASPGRLTHAPVVQSMAPVQVGADEAQEADEFDVQSDFLACPAPQPTSGLVQRLFHRALPQAAPDRPGGEQQQNVRAHAAGAAMVEQMQGEMVRLQEERARVARLRVQLEEGTARLAAEQAAFERRRLEEAARFEAERGEELRKLARDRRVLEKQSRAMMKIPSQRDREEVKAVEAQLEQERKNARAREARHKLQLERLRQQLLEVQQRAAEQREEIAYLEKQKLEAWGSASLGPSSAARPGCTSEAAVGKDAVRRGAGRGPMAATGQLEAKHPGSAAQARAAAGRQAVVRLGSCHASVSAAANSSSTSHLPASEARQTLAAQDAAEQDENEPEVEEADSKCAASATAWEVPLTDEGCVAHDGYQSDGPGTAELLDEDDVLMHSSLPVVHVAVHRAGQPLEMPAAQYGHLLRNAVGQQSQGVSPAAMPADTAAAAQVTLTSERHSSPATARAMGAAEGGASAKASAALDRFNQLRHSLAHQDQRQQQLSNRIAGLVPSPDAAPALGVKASLKAGRPAGGAHAGSAAGADDLRRLGRMLAGSSAATLANNQQEQDEQQGLAGDEHQTAPPPGSSADQVVSSQQYPDGRAERIFASGLREQHFANGSCKLSLLDGRTVTQFANGDIKRVLPSGITEYYFAEAAAWQVSHPSSGVEVFYFELSGQVEAHHPGGVREVVFADGAVRKVLPDGRELELTAAHLSEDIRAPRPSRQLLA